MLSFTVAVFFLLITPGPGVLTTAGIGSGYGWSAGVRFLIGLFIGTNLVAIAVVSGLAAILFSVPWLRNVLMVVSIGYLFYLAIRIAFSRSRIAFIESRKPLGLLNGIALQIINPKAYAVNTALFSGFAFWPESLLAETLVKFAVINAIWVPIHFIWLGAGVGLHRLNLTERAQFLVNLGMALAMLAVVGLTAWAAFASG
jgi:threonine/homoserine/homoserine lactone efflux protein